MFEKIPVAPQDAILGLTEAFKRDSNPNKINLSVGVYKDASGKTPILASVKQAEQRLLEEETSKGYLGIDGTPEYAAKVQELLLGSEHEVLVRRRMATAQTPGGTAALRVAGEFLKHSFPDARVWLSEPTWPNHPTVFTATGVEVQTYPYFDAASNALDFDAMIAGLNKIPSGDVVLLHGCCHNPTGVDPTPDQWTEIANVVEMRGLLPLVDFAYQGFAEGVPDDAAALTALCLPERELLVCSSFSKNFGLYGERVGALSIITATEEAAAAALSQVKTCIRANYSNPPAHGAAIVTTVLDDPKLRDLWHKEVNAMRDRINGMRRLFVKTLAAEGAKGDFSFIGRQRGMFSFSGLTPEQVDRLREDHSIYIVRSGRINVAGMTESNIEPLCRAIVEVL